MKWSPGLNLLTGGNGAGKTNILEGISIISGWGTLEKGEKASDIPTWNSGSSEVQLTGEISSGEIIKVKVAKRFFIKVDDKTVTASELRWKIPVLSFLSEDISIVEGSSSNRRRLLDMMLAIIVPSYAFRLSEYRRGVRQKALFLKKGLPTIVVDRALLPLAAWLWKMREEGVKLLSEELENLSELTPARIELSLKRGGAGMCADPDEDYSTSVFSYREREAALKFPIVGPHRDDIIITADERQASSSLSRGLRRRTAVSLMLAAAGGVRRKTGKNAVLLLDEVTAELDENGRNILFDSLLSRGTQVFAATAEPFSLDIPCAVHTVRDGRIAESRNS